ncbi:hypothetical protein AQ490_24335 [Wenjunlia vitaminophila]|uniref:Uncharacterized protein n=1 Tax=Wenjunlia vitaminophila TaxID=76728 RepID=A0A0T6LRN4_WENVI|nr:hypothetical protein [Wenjunlia vitaminophila]KRV48664.1 hypothetical protein AQ490_24335 [Wenjunlia vitaminophila]
MGTSTAWPGPRGGPWSTARRQLTQWRPDRDRGRAELLDGIAERYLRALHQTLRDDPSAFGLRDAARAAGERLTDTLGSLATQCPASAEALLARLATEVGGDGGTVADAVTRAAALAAGRAALERHPTLRADLSDGAEGRNDGRAPAGPGLPSDILCLLYRLFFAETVAGFLRSVVAEHITLAVPPLLAIDAVGWFADPDGRFAEFVAERVEPLVPDPCEAAAGVVGPVGGGGFGDLVGDAFGDVVGGAFGSGEADEPGAGAASGAGVLATARRLVPTAVDRVLGLITEPGGEEGEVA